MPSMANITVKASNGTTDVVYVAKTPSAGDTIPCRWTVDAASAIPSHRPTLTAVFRDNGPKNGRTFRISGTYPIIETINGVPTILARVPLDWNGVLPTNVDAAKVKEGVYQFGNLAVSVMVRSMLEEGYGAT